MAERVKITSPDELERWLTGGPRAWAVAIAVRAALRALPALGRSTARGRDVPVRANFILAVFRATLTSSAQATEPANSERAVNAAEAAVIARGAAAIAGAADPAAEAVAEAAAEAAYAAAARADTRTAAGAARAATTYSA